MRVVAPHNISYANHRAAGRCGHSLGIVFDFIFGGVGGGRGVGMAIYFPKLLYCSKLIPPTTL